MNIRTMATAGLLILASFTTAFTAGTIAASAATAIATPAQEAAACSAVYHYHHEAVTDYGGAHVRATERAWYHAAHLALYADPEMHRDIRHYLFTGNGWSLVRSDCSPDQGL